LNGFPPVVGPHRVLTFPIQTMDGGPSLFFFETIQNQHLDKKKRGKKSNGCCAKHETFADKIFDGKKFLLKFLF
jgi:hypothetical protein